MIYASREDIQSWLGAGKLTVNDANASKPNLDAARLIRGQLTGTFSVATIATWGDPEDTPELIRSVSGRLTAAFMYREAYSQEDTDVPKYAQELYIEAIAIINDIKSGVQTVVDGDGNPITSDAVVSLSFWPNDSTPKFTMDGTFS